MEFTKQLLTFYEDLNPKTYSFRAFRSLFGVNLIIQAPYTRSRIKDYHAPERSDCLKFQPKYYFHSF